MIVWHTRRHRAKFVCIRCGRSELQTRAKGCGAPQTRWHWAPYGFGMRGMRPVQLACPMKVCSPFRRFLFNRFGIRP